MAAPVTEIAAGKHHSSTEESGARLPMRLIAQYKRLVRFRPFSQDTEEGRSLERYRRIVLSGAGAAAAKAVRTAAMFVTIPMALHYLGQEQFGLWTTITATVSMASFMDLGIGNGLMTMLAGAWGTGNQVASLRYVSSSFFSLCFIAAALALTFGLLYPFIPWANFFNVDTSLATKYAGPATAVVVTIFCLNIALGAVTRTHQALQQDYVNSFWDLLSTALNVVGVLLVIHFDEGPLWLIVAFNGTLLMATLFNGLVLWFWQRPELRPRLRECSRETANKVLRFGGLFFILQVCVAIAYQADSLVIARVLGARYVTEYNIPFRLFQIAPTLLAFVIAPLWPAYGEAIERGDKNWVFKTLRRSLWLSLAVSLPPSLLLIGFGGQVLHFWVGNAVHPTGSLLIGMGIWAVLMCVSNAIAMFLNALRVVKLQVVCSVLATAFNIGLSILLTYRLGVSGVVWGSIIAQSVFILIPVTLALPKIVQSELRPAAI